MISSNLEAKRDCHFIQAQTARNASQKIHQVTDDREMALD